MNFDTLVESILLEFNKKEVKVRSGQRTSTNNFSGNKGDAKDRGHRVVKNRKQIKKDAEDEHDNKSDAASERWKEYSLKDRNEISDKIKNGMQKAHVLHRNRGEGTRTTSGKPSEFERIWNAALYAKEILGCNGRD